MDYVSGIAASEAMLGNKQDLDRLVIFYCQTVKIFENTVAGDLPETLFEERISNVAAARSPFLAKRHTAFPSYPPTAIRH